MRKLFFILLATLFFVLGLVFFNKELESIHNATKEKKPLLATTIYPIYEFTKTIAGDQFEVINLIPFGAEPHAYEPNPRQIALLSNAALIFYAGAGMEEWMHKIIQTLVDPSVCVDMSRHIDLIEFDSGRHDHDANHNHGLYDPHYWLDPLRAIVMADVIASRLAAIDTKNANLYLKRAETLKSRLLKLHDQFESGLKNCQKHEIVVTHDAFNYLAGRYGFKTITILGLSPEEEPSPKKVAHICDVVKEHGIDTIFYETLVNPKISEVIAEETGAKTAVLNPLGNLSPTDLKKGKDYFSVMQENLARLQEAMKCTP